jgi:hypothetical protein
MRAILLMLLLAGPGSAGGAFGCWKLNPGRSMFPANGQPRDLTVRIEPHAKGEVFTVDRVERDGRAISESTILYLDGKPRDFQNPACSGTQSSQKVDDRTVEILRKCGTGEWTRFIRRLTTVNQLTLEITAQEPDGRQVARRLVLDKQSE